jgi:RND superfamily putative drug exporter
MSRLLLHLGRFVARRPCVAIVAWIALAAIIIGSSSAFGGELDDRFGVAGSDSDRAMQVLERAGANESGLTAQVVLTPTASRRTGGWRSFGCSTRGSRW